jgi:hypothetical protein
MAYHDLATCKMQPPKDYISHGIMDSITYICKDVSSEFYSTIAECLFISDTSSTGCPSFPICSFDAFEMPPREMLVEQSRG